METVAQKNHSADPSGTSERQVVWEFKKNNTKDILKPALLMLGSTRFWGWVGIPRKSFREGAGSVRQENVMPAGVEEHPRS